MSILLSLSLALFLAASIWSLLGGEAESISTQRFQLAAIGVSAFLSAAIWIASSGYTSLVKTTLTTLSLIAMVVAGIISDREFESGNHVLEPARVRDGRVIHDGLGLSYAVLPGFRFNLQPMITQAREQRSNKLPLPYRLRVGEMAVLSRIVQNLQSPQQQERSPTSFILEVQRAHVPDLNALFLEVRKQETKWATFENIQITTHAHCTEHAGLEFAEFEFIEMPRRLMSRQVFLRTRTLVLNFMLNTELEADRALFDRFLDSIRLKESADI